MHRNTENRIRQVIGINCSYRLCRVVFGWELYRVVQRRKMIGGIAYVGIKGKLTKAFGSSYFTIESLIEEIERIEGIIPYPNDAFNILVKYPVKHWASYGIIKVVETLRIYFDHRDETWCNGYPNAGLIEFNNKLYAKYSLNITGRYDMAMGLESAYSFARRYNSNRNGTPIVYGVAVIKSPKNILKIRCTDIGKWIIPKK